MKSPSLLPIVSFLLSAGLLRAEPVAAEGSEVVRLPVLAVEGGRVANDKPVGACPTPVSGLSFEPQVDVQARNRAEGQADVAVRGGIFENTGFRLGGVNLLDPQTGHYAAEIPAAPAMLAPVLVGVGADGALGGLNSAVASLEYGWRRIRSRGEMSVAAGGHGTWRGSLYEGAVLAGGPDSGILAADVEFARSESAGALPGGDHEFQRIAGRLQRVRDGGQTDLFAGYQAKFVGWPNLYTPFGWLETDHVRTTVFAVNHRAGGSGGDFWEVSAIWRRNVDDYEADRTRPGVFNPYEHETRYGSAAIEARQAVGAGWTVHARAEAAADEIDSTSLTFGRFRSRTYWKGGAVLGRAVPVAPESFVDLAMGGTWADDNRGGGMASPVAEVAWRRDRGDRNVRFYAQMAGSSQVPGYTALNSNPASGLFRGNPGLPRERCTNWELGAAVGKRDLEFQGAVFLRRERGLTDWTYRNGVTARTANAVDVDTGGVETVVTWRWSCGRAVFGYTWLQKDADYRGAAVDASFYALNFPRHRGTLAVVWRPLAQWEIRLDNEYRIQEANSLRRHSPRALLSSAGVHWMVPGAPGLELSVQADNLWNSTFEEVPAVPAAPRQWAVGATYRW